MDATKLIAYLPFDTSTTADLCGNTWTAYNAPTIVDNTAVFNGANQYLELDGTITLGGQDFTINFDQNKTGGAARATPFNIYYDESHFMLLNGEGWYINYARTNSMPSGVCHIEFDYVHSEQKVYFFVNGTLINSRSTNIFVTRLPYTVRIGTASWGTDGENDYFGGTIDEFMIYDGTALHSEDFVPPTDVDYADLKFALGEETVPVSYTFDVERVIKNDAYIQRIAQSLKVWLPFDSSPTEDLCGNEWTIVGSLAIEDGALALESSSTRNYLITNPPELGMSDFTIDWWEYIPSSVNSFTGQMLGIDGTTGSNTRCLALAYWGSSAPSMDLGRGTGASWSYDAKSIGTKIRDQWVHRAVVRSGNTIYAFENGTLFTSVSFSYSISVSGSSLFIGNFARENRQFVGKLKNVRIHVGAALWTANFTPPTDADYAALKIAGVPFTLTADLERKVKNPPLTWRYENAGDADDLLVGSWTQCDLPESQSKTGIAFVNTHRQKCFDLPATAEVWLKFDVYFDGSNRWRAYNGGSNGTTGITAQTNGELTFFSNDVEAYTVAGKAAKNQLQTVLLHMISGSSNGVIEAWIDGTFIYRYTGDVNHGEDFADLYLQSDGGNTFFSNVIISNSEILFGEGWQIFHYDVDRTVDKTLELDFDLSRRVKNVVDFELAADVELKYFLPVTLTADLRRNVIRALEFDADIELLDVIPTEFIADLELKRPIKIKLYPTNTSEYFSGDGVTPVTIPTQKVIPPAHDEEASLQSIELVIAEQQITDQVKATGIIPFEIMSVAEGEVLDYVCDMRVERVTQRGILYTCDCCSDIDALLFTQMNYTLPASTTWHKAGEGDTTQEIETHYPPATEHVNKIANALGLQAVIQFDNFLSTVLMDDLGGVTYNDLIRDVFGWSSRVPTMMINVYIRNGKLFVIQRGHEANVIDISDADKTLPTYTRELVRTTWGSTPWSKTETRETQYYRPPEFSSSSSSIGGGDDSGEGGGGSGGGGNDDDDSGDDKEKAWLAVGSVTTSDSSGTTTTTYYYDDNGVLQQTVADFTSYVDSKEDNTKTTTNSYNSDDLLSSVSTEIYFPNDRKSNSTVITTYGYLDLPDGKKFLSTEMTSEYDADGKLVEQRVTTKSPTGRGQGSANDDDGNSGTGGNRGDDRPTPYQRYSTNKTKEAMLRDALKNPDGTNPDGTSPAASIKADHESDYYTETESRTVNGLSLYDSSFPIHDTATLIKLTNELRRLNRKTRETVTLSVYGLPHVIDFNDRIVLNGNEYFLVSNRLTITARLYNEQTLTLTRWY